MKLTDIIYDIVLESYSDLNELGTENKQIYDKGAFHNIYQSKNNPNVLYKIGTEKMVDSWVNIFKSRPDLFPKVYRTGKMNYELPRDFTELTNGDIVKHKAGDVIKISYVEIEKLDVRQAIIHWDSLDNIIKTMSPSNTNLQTYLTHLGLEDSLEDEFVELGDKLKGIGNEYGYELFRDFYNLLIQVYEIKPAADVHKRNFGYDKDMKLKMLDI